MQRSLAERLRVLRARKGLSLLAASEQLGVDRHTLRDLELGQGRTARYPTLAKIAEGYGVPVEDLLEEPVPLADAPRRGSSAEGHLYVFLSWDYIEENFSFEQVLELCKGVYDRRVTVYEHGASISRELMADEVGV